ncbi:MAG: amino acid decarboxylase [Bryobacteraceae bacterium]|nr:amino acid decarboxylase [Bryobacteraceae bacterium]
MPDTTIDMPPEEFRRAGHEVIEWIAEYLDGIRNLPVLPAISPGEVRAQLPQTAPDTPESIDRILDDFRNIIVPANTHWNHPRFHAYFSVSASSPGILAEALTAALNVNGMVWKSSPAFTELELTVVDWLRQWLGLPDSFLGVIYDTASVSTMHALIAARDFVDPDSRARGSRGDLIVYTSEQAHSSVEKGAMAIGIGQDNVRKIGVDAEFRMRPELLAQALEQDVGTGKRPCCIVPTVGTTSTTSIDPVSEVIDIGARYGAWVHVDGAYGGCAGIVPEFRYLMDSVDRAHSFVVNPHKWLFTPIDCSVLYLSRPEHLRRALSLTPEYLKTTEDDRVVNLMEYGVPLGRRFRALKLWFVMRWFGRDRMAAIIRSHVEMARALASEIAADDRFEISAPVPLSLVCFRLRHGDAATRQLLQRVNEGGVAFLSHTVLQGNFVLRLALGNLRTTGADIRLVWQTLQKEAATVLACYPEPECNLPDFRPQSSA